MRVSRLERGYPLVRGKGEVNLYNSRTRGRRRLLRQSLQECPKPKMLRLLAVVLCRARPVTASVSAAIFDDSARPTVRFHEARIVVGIAAKTGGTHRSVEALKKHMLSDALCRARDALGPDRCCSPQHPLSGSDPIAPTSVIATRSCAARRLSLVSTIFLLPHGAQPWIKPSHSGICCSVKGALDRAILAS